MPRAKTKFPADAGYSYKDAFGPLRRPTKCRRASGAWPRMMGLDFTFASLRSAFMFPYADATHMARSYRSLVEYNDMPDVYHNES